MFAHDIYGNGAGWNLFLSMYLPDEVIDVIYSMVDELSHLTEPDDLIQKVLTQFTSGVCVDDDGCCHLLLMHQLRVALCVQEHRDGFMIKTDPRQSLMKCIGDASLIERYVIVSWLPERIHKK